MSSVSASRTMVRSRENQPSLQRCWADADVQGARDVSMARMDASPCFRQRTLRRSVGRSAMAGCASFTDSQYSANIVWMWTKQSWNRSVLLYRGFGKSGQSTTCVPPCGRSFSFETPGSTKRRCLSRRSTHGSSRVWVGQESCD